MNYSFQTEPKPQTSTAGGGGVIYTTWTLSPEEDPENLGRRINSLSKSEALELLAYLKHKYKI
jgi:hypothetical protein